MAPHQACQGKCPDRNTSALAAALAVKSGNNKQHIFIALADAINDLPMPCHEQRTGAATGNTEFSDVLWDRNDHRRFFHKDVLECEPALNRDPGQRVSRVNRTIGQFCQLRDDSEVAVENRLTLSCKGARRQVQGGTSALPGFCFSVICRRLPMHSLTQSHR